ncbi:MAG: PAS domain-containing protein [Parvibaculum sedimenti]|uniref:PAS domain-containing protein n=1 Tax=Parvibaculum sedimenti TaxID=2608632 RepID=UPI003BB62E2B
MFSSHSDESSTSAQVPMARSAQSLAFEEAWRVAKGDEAFPDRSAIDLKRFAKFARWFAIIEPDPNKVSLPFRLVGSGFFDFFKTDLTGLDYLALVDPAIKTLAYDSVMACLAQPCGLWQVTPAQIADGATMPYEYTILPISRGRPQADHIVIYVNFEMRTLAPRPHVDRVEHSTLWHWLDIGFGVPTGSFGLSPA